MCNVQRRISNHQVSLGFGRSRHIQNQNDVSTTTSSTSTPSAVLIAAIMLSAEKDESNQIQCFSNVGSVDECDHTRISNIKHFGPLRVIPASNWEWVPGANNWSWPLPEASVERFRARRWQKRCDVPQRTPPDDITQSSGLQNLESTRNNGSQGHHLATDFARDTLDTPQWGVCCKSVGVDCLRQDHHGTFECVFLKTSNGNASGTAFPK